MDLSISGSPPAGLVSIRQALLQRTPPTAALAAPQPTFHCACADFAQISQPTTSIVLSDWLRSVGLNAAFVGTLTLIPTHEPGFNPIAKRYSWTMLNRAVTWAVCFRLLCQRASNLSHLG